MRDRAFAEHHMSRVARASGSARDLGTPEEFKTTVQGTHAYFGTYSVMLFLAGTADLLSGHDRRGMNKTGTMEGVEFACRATPTPQGTGGCVS